MKKVYFEDKHHLAVMCIPIILSMVIGLSAGAVTAGNIKKSNQRQQRAELTSQTHLQAAQPWEKNTSHQTTRSKHMARVAEAIEIADYRAFNVAAMGTPFRDIMTKEAFHELVSQYRKKTIQNI